MSGALTSWRSAVGLDATGLKQNASRAAAGKDRVVRHEDERRTRLAVEFKEQLGDDRTRSFVQAAGGLVGHQYGGARNKGPCERDALLLAARERGWVVHKTLAQSDSIEQVGGHACEAPRGHGACAELQWQHDVLERGQMRQQLKGLKDEPDAASAHPGASVLVQREEFLTQKADGSRTGHVEAREQAQQRRLARAGGTQDRYRLAGVDRQIDVVDNREAAARLEDGLAQCARLERGVRILQSGRRGGLRHQGIAGLPTARTVGSFLLSLCLALTLASTPARAQPRAESSTPIVVLGDSLSAEYGLPRGSGWVKLLADRVAQRAPQYRVVNASISGDTTSGGRARLGELLQREHPGVVIIELGANDGLRGLSVEAMRANLQAMIDTSRRQGARVLLIGMRMPPNYGTTYGERFYSVYTDLAQHNRLGLVPFLLDGFADRLDWFQADHIHPLPQAQPAMLENVWPHLQPLLLGSPVRTN